jgi:hypothetical protein
MNEDQLLTRSWRDSQVLHPAYKRMTEATVIYAQNAFEYCMENGWFDDRAHTQNAIIAPPMDNFLIQFEILKNAPSPVGLHFSSTVLEEGEDERGARWVYDLDIWIGVGAYRRAVGLGALGEPIEHMKLWVNPDGTINRVRAGDETVWQKNVGEDEINSFRKMVIVGAFTLNLLHCKNVHLIEADPSKRERRKAAKKNRPMERYHVLRVGSVGRGGTDRFSSGIRMSEHIVHGHFREYSEEAPLFGKYAGRFWVPAHVRGDRKVGSVKKDYEVEATQGNDK